MSPFPGPPLCRTWGRDVSAVVVPQSMVSRLRRAPWAFGYREPVQSPDISSDKGGMHTRRGANPALDTPSMAKAIWGSEGFSLPQTTDDE
jgi:hypothetical protein